MLKVRSLFVGLIAALTCLAMAVTPASADPDAVREAQAALDRIHQEASALDQEIIEASVRAEESQDKLEQLNQDLSAQREKVAEMSDALGTIAVMQFQSSGFNLTAQLLTSDTDTSFLSSLATIQNETDRGNADVQAFQVEQARLADLQSEAEATDRSIRADLKAKEDLAVEYEDKIAEAEAVVDRLEAEERERLRQLELERERQQAEADRIARERAAQQAAISPTQETQTGATTTSETSQATASGSESTESSDSSSGTSPAGDSSRAQTAVNAAMSKVGSRYSWGSSGPNAFDCSGLTSWAYRQVGITLPRSSRQQASMGTSVSKSDLRPGDLVFYYSPISHVAIYIGNGQIVDAANSRTGVRVASVNSMPYSGARRVA